MAQNAFYAQSGGVTAVINASACGVIETARKHRNKIGKLYAGRNGIIGALTEDMIDTTAESARAIAALRHTPCHVLAIFNLGLVLEELRQGPAAIDAYRRAIDIDAGFADAHYNLARLYEEHGDRRAALRHLARYRALAGERKV